MTRTRHFLSKNFRDSRASFVKDARASNARKYAWFSGGPNDFPLPHLFSLQSRTDGFFTFREIDRRDVAVVLAKSLQTLVDQSSPTTAIRWTTSSTSATIMLIFFQVSSSLSREGQQHSLPPRHRLHPGHQRQPAHLPKLRFNFSFLYFLFIDLILET